MFPSDILPEHCTSTVIALFGVVQTDRSILPILADALQDAGCENERMLGFLRDGSNLEIHSIFSGESKYRSRSWSWSRSRSGS